LTNSNDRPTGVGRNTGRGFDFAALDLRLRRHFRLTERIGLDLSADGFNLFNRANLAVPNNTFGSRDESSHELWPTHCGIRFETVSVWIENQVLTPWYGGLEIQLGIRGLII
jgi:hypothetical protein